MAGLTVAARRRARSYVAWALQASLILIVSGFAVYGALALFDRDHKLRRAAVSAAVAQRPPAPRQPVAAPTAAAAATKPLREMTVEEMKKAFEPDPLREAREDMRKALKDPESARFEYVESFPRRIYGVEETVFCGKVNAKNGYGGYDGMTDFIVFQWHGVHFDRDNPAFATLEDKYCSPFGSSDPNNVLLAYPTPVTW